MRGRVQTDNTRERMAEIFIFLWYFLQSGFVEQGKKDCLNESSIDLDFSE